MKKFIIFMTFICAFVLSGCGGNLQGQPENYITPDENMPDYTKNSVISEYMGDINSDGEDDTVSLYIDAEFDKDGTLMKNHSNRWSLCVLDGATKNVCTLYDETIQHGDLYFQIMDFFENKEVKTNIMVYKNSGAELKIKSYVFEKDKGFLDNTIYNSSDHSEGGINLRFSTVPEN